MGADSHKAAFSPTEKEAISLLEAHGIDLIPAYIGRARAYLNCGHHDSSDPRASAPVEGKSAQEIVSYVLELINFDQELAKFLQRRAEDRAVSEVFNKLTLSEPDRIAAQDLANAIREAVDYERSKGGVRMAAAGADRARLALYPAPDQEGAEACYFGKVKFLGREVFLRAWPASSRAFVNLELEVR